MKMHPCSTCPFMNLASEDDLCDDIAERLFGWCQKDRKTVFVAKSTAKLGCGEHPETMQQYEELRGTAYRRSLRRRRGARDGGVGLELRDPS